MTRATDQTLTLRARLRIAMDCHRAAELACNRALVVEPYSATDATAALKRERDAATKLAHVQTDAIRAGLDPMTGETA